MNRLSKTIVTVSLLSLAFVSLGASRAHGQNFAGTVTADTQVQGQDVNAPFVSEPADEQAAPAPAQATETQDSDDVAAEEYTKIPKFITEMSQYTLGENDVIEVGVMRHPEVSGQYIVNKEGNIQYEFVGDIHVEGMTKDQVKEELNKRLATFIINPEVTIKIVGYNSKIVYVIGEVASPGKIFMRGDTITVREALVQAGLPLLTAKTGAGRVVTPSEDGKAKIRKVNIEKLLVDGDLRENLVMKPGDTLYVPPTFLAKTMRIINPIAQPIGTVSGAGRAVMMPGL